jgi:multiple sugar transport system permease protein
MKRNAFLMFVAPSMISMLLLIAMPLVGVVYLALHQSYVKSQLVEVTTEVPLFGGLKREETRMVRQPVLDEAGEPTVVWEFVGGRNLARAADVEGLSGAIGTAREARSISGFVSGLYDEIRNVDFWSALEFTLLYTFITTPFILLFGLALALAVNRASQRLRGAMVFVSLLPMIVTPVVSSLAVYWLFIDGAVIPSLLSALGIGRFYFLADQVTIRAIIIAYGIWFATPFAFIILFAGLQTVPQETVEAAAIDGASKLQRLRYVVVPYLAPLMSVITLIHVMDSYRVFEPILVFGSSVFANSVQYLTYQTLAFENNIHKAAAYALLTLVGVVILLIPVLIRTFRDQRTSR